MATSRLSRTRAQQRLRHVGVLREGELRDAAYARAFEASNGVFAPLPLPHPQHPVAIEQWPALAQVRQFGGEPRCEGRDASTLIGELKAMREQYGTLVFLTAHFPDLDHHSMVWAEGRRAIVLSSKKKMWAFLSIWGKRTRALTLTLQRDLCRRTHGHGVTHLSGLCDGYQRALLASPRGKKGGVMLNPWLHGVIIGESDDDVDGASCYMCKFPDERHCLPDDDPERMDLLEELAERMIYGEEDPPVKLIWRLPKGWKPGRKPT